jgi:hypothetical protein
VLAVARFMCRGRGYVAFAEAFILAKVALILGIQREDNKDNVGYVFKPKFEY